VGDLGFRKDGFSNGSSFQTKNKTFKLCFVNCDLCFMIWVSTQMASIIFFIGSFNTLHLLEGSLGFGGILVIVMFP
jgi:hypothetical protein